ncbi:MAG TPA: thiamine pyrophosphate-binding protein [Nitrososphaerales archaeon]|nr:thiamine pyrophosphate-binding protein [Nitrososphaerales archaeon]
MNVAQLLVQRLEQFGVRRTYGLIGTSILDLVDVVGGSGLRYLSTRFDQSAASMAVAEGKITGRPGVALLHGGPGCLNAVTAVAVAYKDSVPMMLVAGAVKRRLGGLDSWLEVPQLRLFSEITKGAYRIDRPAEADRIVSEAFWLASSAPKGPVFVEVPEDVWRLEATPMNLSYHETKPAAPGGVEIEHVARLLKDSKAPLILAGGGVNDVDSSDLLVRVAERFGVPVATTGNGRGAIPEDHPLFLGRVGFGGGSAAADYALAESDLLLCVGCGLSDVSSYGYNYVPKGQVVAVTLDEKVGDRPVPYASVVQADARGFLDEVMRRGFSCSPSEEWKAAVSKKRAEWASLLSEACSRSYPGRVNPSAFFTALDRRMSKETIVAAGQGLHIVYVYDFLRVRSPASFLAATNLGAMGYALPAALGAKLCFPAREVFAVVGDGEFMMSVQELETAVREKIGVGIVIVNDDSYRVLLMRQKIQKMGRVYGTVHRNPDVKKLAEAFGAEALVVDSDQQTEQAVSFLMEKREGPRIVELKVSGEDMPPMNFEASMKF